MQAGDVQPKTSEGDDKTYARLLDKSQEAFMLAIELYNRPAIRYHAEGCSFFLCNAWELMLKAYLVKTEGIKSIYYPGNEKERCPWRIALAKFSPM